MEIAVLSGRDWIRSETSPTRGPNTIIDMPNNNNRRELPAATGERIDRPEDQSGLAPDQAGLDLAREVLDTPEVETPEPTPPQAASVPRDPG